MTLVLIAFCGIVFVAVFNQRRRVEADLRSNQERFSRLAATAPGMICSFRVNDQGVVSIPYSSPVIWQLLALSPDEVKHHAGAFIRQIPPEDRNRVLAAVHASRSSLDALVVEYRYAHPTRGELWLESFCAPVLEADGACIWHGFVQDTTQRKQSDRHIERLMGEVNHRAKNLLTVVQAMAYLTVGVDNPAVFLTAFEKRLRGLASTHDLLMESNWGGVHIAAIVHAQLAHFGDLVGHRIHMTGPTIKLNPTATQAIGMAIHELATNAAKYGSLSNRDGAIHITWMHEGASSPADADAGKAGFQMRWEETGGPPVTPASRKGFGHDVVVEMPTLRLGADIRLDYAPSGVTWELIAPAQRVIDGGPPTLV